MAREQATFCSLKIRIKFFIQQMKTISLRTYLVCPARTMRCFAGMPGCCKFSVKLQQNCLAYHTWDPFDKPIVHEVNQPNRNRSRKRLEILCVQSDFWVYWFLFSQSSPSISVTHGLLHQVFGHLSMVWQWCPPDNELCDKLFSNQMMSLGDLPWQHSIAAKDIRIIF